MFRSTTFFLTLAFAMGTGLSPAISPGHANAPRMSTLSLTIEKNAYNKEDLYCLALNAYFEARNQPIDGKVAVMHVVLNRVESKRFPNTVCGVIKQAQKWNGRVVKSRCQFSWFCDGKSDKPRNMQAWILSLILAEVVLDGQSHDITNGALWYHANYVTPRWAKKKPITLRLGDHIFYGDFPL